MLSFWACWLLLILYMYGTGMVILRGLRGEPRQVTYGASDVLGGCVLLFLVYLAARELLR